MTQQHASRVSECNPVLSFRAKRGIYAERLFRSELWRAVKRYWVYIMTNRNRTLYVGVTGNLERRVYQHQRHLLRGFASRYVIDRLVYAEDTSDVTAALTREKEIKAWRRSKKVALVESVNPKWRDLSLDMPEIRRHKSLRVDSSLRSE